MERGVVTCRSNCPKWLKKITKELSRYYHSFTASKWCVSLLSGRN